ncbi:MAG: hypothetical protein ACD_79C01496G0001 [uncultured bacterium]|nr:MAG: hypothetical protein ACD_79C01496G0001 [uncultured bacterium]
MITLKVNGRNIEAGKGENLLTVLKRAGIEVPTLCHIEGLSPTGACRICSVEVKGRPGLVPACAFPVTEEMEIETHSPKALQARKTIVELLLADHPDDCLYCVKNMNCHLQNLAGELGVRQRRFEGEKNTYQTDISSPSIERDPSKCILCGKCVRVCEEIQGVSAIDFTRRGSKTYIGTAFNEGMNVSSCIYCGQCIKVCPTGALREQSSIKDVINALNDPEKIVTVQHAPAVSVTLGEEFNMDPGADTAGVLVTALRRLKFDWVFDTSFSADLTIMEEASELVHRIKNNGKLPMLTSCSPGWIKFVEQFYPEFMDNLSTCKSPQQMMGAVVKSYFAGKNKIDPKKIFNVSIMPCTAKKFESDRPEMGNNGIQDVDAVLTTRELVRMIRMRGIDLNKLNPDIADNPFGERSSAGKLFGGSGGVMEAALRTAYNMLTGRNLDNLKIEPLRGLDSFKQTTVNINGLDVGVAVVSGLKNARKLLDEIKAGRNDLHFIEVMTCPGGCVAGGGQPGGIEVDAIKKRLKGLYTIDSGDKIRCSHENPSIQMLYKEFLHEPLSHKSHELLHTHYNKRNVIL